MLSRLSKIINNSFDTIGDLIKQLLGENNKDIHSLIDTLIAIVKICLGMENYHVIFFIGGEGVLYFVTIILILSIILL